VKKFAIIGAAGYVAAKHVNAIKEVGGDLVAAYDVVDNVGYLDSHFMDCRFTNQAAEFSDLIDELEVDYVSICTPSYLHVLGVISMLAQNKNVICEKPLCLYPNELDAIQDAESKSKGTVNTILQLMYHPLVLNFQDRAQSLREGVRVNIQYFSPRGDWYFRSWKGNDLNSGGLITNIGIHVLHLLVDTFGEVLRFDNYSPTSTHNSFDLVFANSNSARVELDICKDIAPQRVVRITDNGGHNLGNELRFDLGAHIHQDLHTAAYRSILTGTGATIEQVRPSIELASLMRKKKFWEKS